MLIRSAICYLLFRTTSTEPENGRRRGCCCRSWLAGSRFHLDIYCSGEGSNGSPVGPDQIGSDRGPDCPRSVWGKGVRGRVQEGEGGLGVCNDRQGHEWASGVML